MVEVGSGLSDANTVAGKVVRVMGDNLEILLDRPVSLLTESLVIVLSRATPELSVAQGAIVVGEGREYQVELRVGSSGEQIRPGSRVQVVVR
jgi:hypothetical protein